MSGDFKTVLRKAQKRGWTVTRRHNSHLKLTHESGAIFFTSSTPSDYRTGKNLECALRRLERKVREPEEAPK